MNNNFAYRTYQDEPIIIGAIQMESLTPPKYRAMRKLAVCKGGYPESVEKIFYKQGKFMEDFEDDFDYRGEFVQYFPTYQSMNDHQLRGYFSWRTRVRRGEIRKTSLSFAFVYIYELINQIGVCDPEEGFYALKNFWAAYKELDYSITRYVQLWLKDFIVYYNLDKSLFEDSWDQKFSAAVLTLLNHKSHGTDEIFSALNSLSAYNFRNSRFFKQYPDDVKNVICAVFYSLSDYYDKNRKNTLCEKLFGRFYTSSYNMFNSAVFYDHLHRNDYVYKISDLCKYTCKNGKWSCENFFQYSGKNRQIRAMLKAIDFNMRQKYNFAHQIRAVKTSKILADIIDKVIVKYLESKNESARPQIEIDVSRLQNIRKTALETQSKLLIEEELEESGAPAFPEAGPPAPGNLCQPSPENGAGLSDAEYLFMKCLLYGQVYKDQTHLKGLPVSVMIDAINEKLFDRFGDTVIIEAGGGPELIADYVEELKEIIRK